MLTSYFITMILIALLSAFILLLLDKWKFIDYVQIRGNKFFSKMFRCEFCLSFWISVIICFSTFPIHREPIYLTIPFLSTVLTRRLL